jgi:hypothetical protein
MFKSKAKAEMSRTIEALQGTLERQAREYRGKITLLETQIGDLQNDICGRDARIKGLQEALDWAADTRDIEVERLKEDNASLRDIVQEKDRVIKSKERHVMDTSVARVRELERINKALEREVASARLTRCCCHPLDTAGSSSNSRPYDVSLGERVRYQREVLRMSESQIRKANRNLPR